MAFRAILVVLIYLSLSLINICEARYHHHNHNHHKKHKQNPHHHRPPGPHISLPPSPPPEASPPSQSPSPPPDYTETFDVRAFGAIGDGVSDDTEAFKSAWDAACQLQSADDESAILVIPSGYSFLVQSTIFTGPCETDIIFQVLYIILFLKIMMRILLLID